MIVDKLYQFEINKINRIRYEKIMNKSLNIGEIIELNYAQISNYSHSLIIEYLCDYCGYKLLLGKKEITLGTKIINKMSCKKCRHLKQSEILIITHGVSNYSQLEEVKEKKKKTLFKNYGVESPWHSEEIMDKKNKTMIDRYGTINPMENPELRIKARDSVIIKYGVDSVQKVDSIKLKAKETRIKNGYQIPDEFIEPYKLYRREVIKETYKHKKNLIDKWDGYDYYDKEYIREYNDHKNKPTIDHKISIQYGFINNLDPKIIGNIDNLAITKSYINSKKNRSTEYQYKKKFDEKS